MKTLYNIRTKKELVALYISQLSEKNIREYINEIIQKTRPHAVGCKNTTMREIAIFIDRYGLPEGYKLPDEMSMRLIAIRKSQ